jgi:hypothetical protein
MAQLAASWNIRYVSYFGLLCPRKVCTEYVGRDTPLQSDYGHLTKAGSLLVAEKLKEGNFGMQ